MTATDGSAVPAEYEHSYTRNRFCNRFWRVMGRTESPQEGVTPKVSTSMYLLRVSKSWREWSGSEIRLQPSSELDRGHGHVVQNRAPSETKDQIKEIAGDPSTLPNSSTQMENETLKTYRGAQNKTMAIGLMPMTDQGEKDEKIIAVCADDPEYGHLTDISQLPPYRLTEIKRFFEECTKNENKEVAVDEFLPSAAAVDAIQYSMDLYAAYTLLSLRD